MAGTANHTGCFIYASVKRVNNDPFLGIQGFEGIPQNFFINVFFWALLHCLFICLRKKAWNYGRMAVVQKEEIKWAEILYSGGSEGGDDKSEGSYGTSSGRAIVVASNTSEHVNESRTILKRVSTARISTAAVVSSDEEIHEPDLKPENSASVDLPNSLTSSERRLHNISEIRDKGYFSWIKIVFTLTDKEYREKCGHDCVYYLSFQRHLIFLAFIITACSLIVILPINMHRTLRGEVLGTNNETKLVDFSDTTIINLGSKYEYLWFHISFSMVFLFLSVLVMRHFSRKLKFAAEDESETNTVSIIGLNKKKCHEWILRAHFEETYPGTEITEISFAYDIAKLQSAEFQRMKAASAKAYFIQAYEKKKEIDPRPLTIRPHICGATKCCCRCRFCKDTDAIKYYTQCEERYAKQVEEERKIALSKPLGIVYITFKNVESVENIVEDYACSARLFLNAPVSKHTRELRSNQWIVKYAPQPEDINWENLATDYKVWYTRFVVVNVIVGVLAFIFSTPVFLFHALSFTPQSTSNSSSVSYSNIFQTGDLSVLSGLISDTVPAIMLWIMSVVLIAIVSRSDLIIGFWTKTAGNLSEMVKTFLFLILMVVILPSLGVQSFRVFFEKDQSISWSCIFFKDNGAFFVNYVCTSALAGTAAELMRLPELFMYAIKLHIAKSEAETAAIRKSVLWDFQIGVSYAWTMLHFAILTCFSVIYPMVTPFGLIYLLLKHFTDRYNIYFAYAPCKVDKEVHTTAVNFVIMSMFMLQLNLLAYVHFHIGENQYHDTNLGAATDSKIRALQICSLLEFSVTAAFFLGQCCFNICADLSPLGTISRSDAEDDDTESRKRRGSNLSQESGKSRISYELQALDVAGPSGEHTKPQNRYVSPLLRQEINTKAPSEAQPKDDLTVTKVDVEGNLKEEKVVLTPQKMEDKGIEVEVVDKGPIKSKKDPPQSKDVKKTNKQ